MTLKDTLKKLALENAIKFKGKANPNALLGGVIKEHPEEKENLTKIKTEIETICEKINKLSLEEQKTELIKINPDFEKQKQEKKQERRETRSSLPDLPNAIQGKVTTRIPPEPSKYNHLGHAMSFLINYLYAKKYDGKVILRFDDTNPEKSTTEFVEAAKEDILNYLDIKPNKIIFASDHMNTYYLYAEKLVADGNAYVCSCNQETMSDGRRNGIECPHRNQDIEENKLLWKRMKDGKFKEGEAVLRLKIDMQHKNAVMRDPVIYRLAYENHYRAGTKYKVWPMYDFESTIEEGLCEITHVMRSNEFDSRIELQKYIAKLFGFPEINYTHYGRYNVVGATTQGREIRALIETGNYIGWDDPRLVTLRALKRRGIIRESYYELAQKIGMSKTQTNLDFSSIAAINRALLDKTSKRFFGIVNPVVIKVHKIPSNLTEINLKFHPENEEKNRKLELTDELYIEKEDILKIEIGQVVRLMDCMNIKKISETEFDFESLTHEEFKSNKNKTFLIHYVPKNGKEIEAEILMDDISVQEIICEQSIEHLKVDEIVQFERFAFCRLDQIDEDGTRLFWFTHK